MGYEVLFVVGAGELPQTQLRGMSCSSRCRFSASPQLRWARTMAQGAVGGNRAGPQFPAQTLLVIEPGQTVLTLDAVIRLLTWKKQQSPTAQRCKEPPRRLRGLQR